MKKVYLSEEDLILIVLRALVKARKLKSLVRKDFEGNATSPKIHIAIAGKGKETASIVHSDEDAWESGKEIAKEKAHSSLKYSSNENAVSSRSLGHMASSGHISHLERMSTVPGGIPLYKSHNGKSVLVGSIGISGDLPEIDEAIAVAASEGFTAPKHIRSDSVLSLPFHNESSLEELPSVPSSVPSSTPPSVPSSAPPSIPSSAPLSKSRKIVPKKSPKKLYEERKERRKENLAAPLLPISRESPIAPSTLPPLVVSSGSVAILPPLSVQNELPLISPSSLPKMDSSLPSSLPKMDSSLPSSLPKMDSSLPSSLPKMDSSLPSSLPKMKSSPSSLPKMDSSLPKMKSSPSSLPKMDSSLPKVKSSPSSLPKMDSSLPKMKSSPSSLPKMDSSLPKVKSSPSLPPLASSPPSSLPKLSSLSSMSGGSSLPPISPPRSPSSLPALPKSSLSSLTQLK